MRVLIKPLKVNVKIELNHEDIHGMVTGIQKVFKTYRQHWVRRESVQHMEEGNVSVSRM